MKFGPLHTGRRPIGDLCIALAILGWLLAAAPAAAAQTESSQDPAAENRQIRITADQLTTDSDANIVEFSGDVEAIQGNFTIRSDTLQIHYRSGGQPKESETAGQDSIQRIVAEGNVRIDTGQQTAQTDRAEYSVSEATLVLIGEGSTVSDGLNRITGSRLTLNRNTGAIRVDGGERRVRAVFYPNSDLGFTEPGGSAGKTEGSTDSGTP